MIDTATSPTRGTSRPLPLQLPSRIGAAITNVPGSHALYITQSAVVSDVIATAAESLSADAL